MTIVHGVGFTCLSEPFSFFVFQGVNKITKKRSLLVKESCYDKALYKKEKLFLSYMWNS